MLMLGAWNSVQTGLMGVTEPEHLGHLPLHTRCVGRGLDWKWSLQGSAGCSHGYQPCRQQLRPWYRWPPDGHDSHAVTLVLPVTVVSSATLNLLFVSGKGSIFL